MSATPVTVRDLRHHWKPHKERLSGAVAEHPTNIRFHRACSWLQRAEQVAGDDDLDLKLLNLWIAFNALYGQWDHEKREPVADQICWTHFLERMLALDEEAHIATVLKDNRRLVRAIFEDEFLSRYYWQEPTDKRASQSRKTLYDSQTWFLQGNWLLVLERLFERIYFLRCQLVHGAATFNSTLNRTATRHCAQAMDHLLRTFLQVWIRFGADEDWGIMCYPPQRTQTATRR